MTGPGDDFQKKKADEAARLLAESLLGLSMSPADLGGEVLFDDYDDGKSPSSLFGMIEPDELAAVPVRAELSPVDAEPNSAPAASFSDSFEDDLDDLIVFGDEDDDEVDDVIGAVDEDDENFDFGAEDDDDDEDDDPEDDDDDEEDEIEAEEDFDDDEEEEEEEDDEDDDLDFGADIDPPEPRLAPLVSRASRPEPPRRDRDERRPDRGRAESRPAETQTPAPRAEQSRHEHPRGENRGSSRGHGAEGGAGRSSGSRPADAGRGREDDRPRRPEGRGPARSDDRRDNRGVARTDRPADSGSGRASSAPGGGSDDSYWQELDEWVWDDNGPPKKTLPSAALSDDGDPDEEIDEDVVAGGSKSESDRNSIQDGPQKGRRGRRRGGRGRGQRQREEGTAAGGTRDDDRAAPDNDLDDDMSEILFGEDQEDIVSVSAGSAQAQRRIREEPPSPPARRPEPEALDDVDDDVESDVDREEIADDRPAGRRRGRRGGRGRGRGRGGDGRGGDGPHDAAQREVAPRDSDRESQRQPTAARRPLHDDDLDQDDDGNIDADVSDFGDGAGQEATPRGDRERHPGGRGGRGRGQDRDRGTREPRAERPPREDRPPRTESSVNEDRPAPRAERPGRDDRPPRESREPREPRESAASDRPPRRVAGRDRNADREGGDESGENRGARTPRVASEFKDIPTWEDAIGCLSIKTPSEDHARRTENRSRGGRDGGRPPRRR